MRRLPLTPGTQLDELAELTRDQARIVAQDAGGLTSAAVAGWCLLAEAIRPEHPTASLLTFAAAYPLGLAVWSLAQRFPLPPGAVVVDPAVGRSRQERWNLTFASVTAMVLAPLALLASAAMMLLLAERGEPVAMRLAAIAVVLATLLFAALRARRAAYGLALASVGFGSLTMGWPVRVPAGLGPSHAAVHLGVLVGTAVMLAVSIAVMLFARAELGILERRLSRLRERAGWGGVAAGGERP